MTRSERENALNKIIHSINSCEADNSDICDQIRKIQSSLDDEKIFVKELNILNNMLKGDYNDWSK